MSTMSMLIRIEILDGPEAGVSHSFQESVLNVGSSPDHPIHLTGEGVAGLHAMVELDAGQGKLVPGPDAGTLRVNGSPVEVETLLQPGDVIHAGEQSFRYKLIPFPHPESHRKKSLLEWVTYGFLAVGFCLQIFLLVGPALTLRNGINREILREPPPVAPVVQVAPPPPTPTPVPPSVIVMPEAFPPAAVDVDLPPTPTPQGKSVSELISEARKRSRAGDDLQAERLLKEAMNLDPDDVAAKIEWAKMLGRQAAFDDSIQVWEEVLEHPDADEMTLRDARLELSVMKRRQAMLNEKIPVRPEIRATARPPRFLETPQPAPTAQVEIPEAPSPINVGRIRMERFPESARYDALRMIHFQLKHPPGTPAVEAGTIQVVVNFYEQVDGKVEMAKIPEPRIVLNLSEGLSRGNQMVELSAAYDVPAGKGSPDRKYFGAVIQVFVDEKEVSRGADPAFLLQMMK